MKKENLDKSSDSDTGLIQLVNCQNASSKHQSYKYSAPEL